jgi:hypothetical protein
MGPANARALTALTEQYRHDSPSIPFGQSLEAPRHTADIVVLHASLFFIDSGIVDLLNVTPHLRGLSEE